MTIDVNAPEIISLSQVFVSFEGEPVQVTHIREETDSDIALYYIARAVRVASGEEIPWEELSELRHIDYMGNRNAPTLTDRDAMYLDACICDRVDN